MMTLEEIRRLTVSCLPRKFALMQLSFYGDDSERDGEYVIIGDDYGSNLCVRLSDGTVWAIDPRGEMPTRFVNSSIQHLSKCIEATKTVTDAKGLRGALAKSDPEALSREENWWACWVEDAEVFGS
jgi:hypothetical protein